MKQVFSPPTGWALARVGGSQGPEGARSHRAPGILLDGSDWSDYARADLKATPGPLSMCSQGVSLGGNLLTQRNLGPH